MDRQFKFVFLSLAIQGDAKRRLINCSTKGAFCRMVLIGGATKKALTMARLKHALIGQNSADEFGGRLINYEFPAITHAR